MYYIGHSLRYGQREVGRRNADHLPNPEVRTIAAQSGVGIKELRHGEVCVVPDGGAGVPVLHGVVFGAVGSGR